MEDDNKFKSGDCIVRWHRGDMEKYLKYRCYYVATQYLLRAQAITFTWPLSSYYVRTQ